MDALLLVDIQNDFLPGGPLAVPHGDQILPVVLRLMDEHDLVVATKDWHPPDHVSFAANHPGRKPGEVIVCDGVEQILWPTHCVQHTRGAEFPEQLPADRIALVVYKGTDPAIDSYSGFFDNGRRRATGLDEQLRRRGVRRLHLAGLATDYCVKFTALDARQLGYDVVLHTAGCRGVDLRPGDVERAIQEMAAAGVDIR